MIARTSATTLGLALVLSLMSSCKMGNADSPYRHREPGVKRIEETTSAGGLFALEPADAPHIECPHCGASNRLGRTTCRKCERRLSTLPVQEPCVDCQGKGKMSDGTTCPTCEGRGWMKKAEPRE